jgi:hypothetical protein
MAAIPAATAVGAAVGGPPGAVIGVIVGVVISVVSIGVGTAIALFGGTRHVTKADLEAFGDLSHRVMVDPVDQVKKVKEAETAGTFIELANDHDEQCTFYIYPTGLMPAAAGRQVSVGGDVSGNLALGVEARVWTSARWWQVFMREKKGNAAAWECTVPPKGHKKMVEVEKQWLDPNRAYCIAWSLESAKSEHTHPGREHDRPLKLKKNRVNMLTLRQFPLPAKASANQA